MENSLSIRSYTRQRQSHAHDYHQLVLPIQGTIHIELTDYNGGVGVGECVVIESGVQHHFTADEAARFIIADLSSLPDNLHTSNVAVFSITPPLLSFLYFVEKQLEFQLDDKLEKSLVDVFMLLLQQQSGNPLVDPRIRAAQTCIIEQLETHLTIEGLAKVACLSPTQFKKRFKEALGVSAYQYITEQRMEKAKALLIHTDLPVQLIAERVGYTDVSAFSRRFSASFGLSPRDFSR
ncbi:AraC family transcriptional regulator [Enterovibrio norvegicus FF-454]|uniref:AraC family transcriptional regulator n=1 Tax=Enterovibrio norvegicus FF-454 TaxID=1185651 RepID=A0A1E5BYN7_9GAMM|nr:AraC family transcriptional regulator [Enterovibrio norvegicus]OEE58394.1 AraC family transcriptional regulator [Enterovibrio norvegicus FF-454]